MNKKVKRYSSLCELVLIEYPELFVLKDVKIQDIHHNYINMFW